ASWAPLVVGSWMLALIAGVTAVGRLPELSGTAEPILYGLAAISGLLLPWWAHTLSTVAIGSAIAHIALTLGEVDAVSDVVAPVLTVVVVAAATALVNFELEREMVVSASRE